MIQTLMDILRREEGDLAARLQQEERSTAPDPSRIRSLRDEVDLLRRQIERMAGR
jgi:ubiquinone biosynthesis protein UbiJ